MADFQILALVRFAYPGLGAFQTEHRSVTERAAHLWAPARMEARLRTLEHVCLGTLRRQTDMGFRTLIVTGDRLPEPWRGRLLALAGEVPGAEVVFHPPMNQRDAMGQIVSARLRAPGPPSIQFRQDDDDGVALDFVERLRSAVTDALPLWRRHGKMAVDFNQGYFLRLTPAGPLVEEVTRPHLGVAQALVLRPGARRTALHFPHHKLARLMPALTFPEPRMWLRGIDGTNDSHMPDALGRLRPASPAQAAALETRFGLDLPAIARSFAAG
ncbi:glycosyltransferase [Jannaschia seohaensis]|uniref:Putative rhamnosyltransferase n=1 Tax=Jannaschia seohaensis TaxID=475081 RepID=A0A2Y9C5Q4_9RHOB|nr:glycosyltransferase [Jannaschia seohaensis]PWJ21313.1 putative rhamnosyltransferase [Jannaschia seohaensis]SSA41723.1 Putative rhamnosyl transferase [Jannaschia seohaensis]